MREREILAASILKKHFAGSGHLYKKEKDHKVTESAKRAALTYISTTYQTFLL